MEKWTSTYNIHKLGHCELIWYWARVSHPRCYQPHIDSVLKSLKLHLSWANNHIYMYSNGRRLDLWWPSWRSQWSRSLHVGRPYKGKQQHTLNSLITCLWKICASVQICKMHINSGPNGHNAQPQFVKKSVSSEQMSYNIHMGDILTSGDLHVGHNDLD